MSRRPSNPCPGPAGDRRPTAAAACLALVLVLALFVLWPDIDPTVSRFMRSLDDGFIDIFRALTDLAKSTWYLIVSASGAAILYLLYHIFQDSRNARPTGWLAGALAFVFVAVAFSGIAVNLLKILFGRARPKLLDREDFYGFEPLSFDSDFHSFPSGHANTAFAIALALGFLIPRWRVGLLIIGAALASTRVFVNAHFPSDIVGGCLVAVITTYWLRAQVAARGFTFPDPPALPLPPARRSPAPEARFQTATPDKGAKARRRSGSIGGGCSRS